MTNGDNIRRMTDEELACFLEIVANGCSECPMFWECTYAFDEGEGDGVDSRLKWLRQEAEDA